MRIDGATAVRGDLAVAGALRVGDVDLSAGLAQLAGQLARLAARVAKLEARTLDADAPHYFQRGWVRCGECALLHLGRNGERSVCPATGDPHGLAPADYTLFVRKSQYGGQSGWSWCRKCQCLSRGGAGPEHCAAGGGHDRTGSLPYLVWAAELAGEQARAVPMERDWRRCRRCGGLAWGGAPGVCPAPGGGGHDPAGSADYHLQYGDGA